MSGAPPVSDAASPPVELSELVVLGVVPDDDGHTVLLGDLKKRRFIPMGVGASEAFSIHNRLEGRRMKRPLTHDLLDSVLKDLGGELVKVQIESLEEGIFYGAVFVKRGRKVMRLDARPSDAIALAIGAEKPILIDANVLERASIPIPKELDSGDGDASEPTRDDDKKPVYNL